MTASDDGRQPAMHEDDTVLGWPWLTRRRIRWLMLALGVLTLVMLLLFGYILLEEHNDNNRNIRELACAMVAPYPDTIPYVRDFRARYDCPPYDPGIASRLSRDATKTGG